MKAVVASDSSHTLEELLSQPSAESWREIIELSKDAKKRGGKIWEVFQEHVKKRVKSFPPEIERLCPASWPADFRAAVEHRVRETDTYGHYLAKLCGHPDLKLSDGSQAVWLERRYTGGIVEVSTVKSALRLLAAAQAASSVKTANERVKDAVRLLAGGTRNVGKVGCADLTGGVVVEKKQLLVKLRPDPLRDVRSVFRLDGEDYIGLAPAPLIRHEYRLEVEVKVGDEPQRPEQVARMESVRRRGGCYVLCNSVESAASQIREFILSR